MREPAARVSQSRLAALLAAMARFGAREDGGVNRQALSDAELEARAFLAQHARSLGCAVAMDAAGNMFMRRAGRVEGAAVVTGSHIDTQPAGGKLDGVYGVCAGLEVIAALNDAKAATEHPVEVVVWSNEEGCRFAPGSLGSQAYVHQEQLSRLLDSRDGKGARYGDCVTALRKKVPAEERPLGAPMRSFLELHIEQGPVLEGAGLPIGIVTGAQGVRWFRVRAEGEAAHAGTTPLAYRRDALRALSGLMEQLYALAERAPELRMTVGKIDVEPASINTVPAAASITVDVRHAQAAQLDAAEALIAGYCAAPRHGCTLLFERLMSMQTTWFDEGLRNSLKSAAERLGLASMDLISGAFHDAVHLARHCPTGMLFVPSERGVSHNPAEHTDPALLAGGARVLALAVAQQAQEN
jgi:beta-ureidopropionase / N-carbamoyl-L-amino-acid hydrolase